MTSGARYALIACALKYRAYHARPKAVHPRAAPKLPLRGACAESSSASGLQPGVIALIHVGVSWNSRPCQITVFVVSIALIHIGVNWNQRPCQIIVFVVPIDRIRIDVNSPG